MEPSTVKILVVDDEPDLEPLIRQGFRRKIRSGEYTFVFAGDGLEALDVLDQDLEIDLVLTDINMPRMDGLKLLANLNDLDRVLKAIVVTAYGDMENIRTAMNQGAFDFLTKPLVLDDLKKTVEKASQAILQQKKADLARQTFGRYLSDEVVATLLDQPEALTLGGEKRKVTLLMSDLRGFSTISERRPPETVVEILNIYLGRMADVITDYYGTIDEFIGDAILVIFGAPILREDDALRAVACAIDMQRAMAGVNTQLAERGLPKLEMGIGINTGEVVVGNIGSLKRTKYGVVGSHVNLTARIESYTVGGQVLTTESTLDAAGAAVLTTVPDGSWSSLGPVVRGAIEGRNATVVTDGWSGYGRLAAEGVDHRPEIQGSRTRAAEVLPWAHLVISNLKAWLHGTFRGVSGKHLDLYLQEFTYRFNRRWIEEKLFFYVTRRALEAPPLPYHRLVAEPIG